MMMLTEKQKEVLLGIKEYTKGQSPKHFRVQGLCKYMGMTNQLTRNYVMKLMECEYVEKIGGGIYSLKKV